MEAKSIYLETFGDSPINKVLDFLVVHEEFDYSMTDIARFSEVGYSTLKLFWNTLEDQSIVICSREVGNARMFKLNFENPIVQKFKQFYWEVCRVRTDERISIPAAIEA